MTVALVAPRVSIVMPCLNEAETVGVCVAKAHAWLRSSGVPGEVLVVDNGSADGSADMVRYEFPEVRLLVNDRNLGYAAGCNQIA